MWCIMNKSFYNNIYSHKLQNVSIKEATAESFQVCNHFYFDPKRYQVVISINAIELR